MFLVSFLNISSQLGNERFCFSLKDVIVEMMNGHNVVDYMDADIMEKLKQLEEEERLREEAGFYDSVEEEDEDPVDMLRIRKTASR